MTSFLIPKLITVKLTGKWLSVVGGILNNGISWGLEQVWRGFRGVSEGLKTPGRQLIVPVQNSGQGESACTISHRNYWVSVRCGKINIFAGFVVSLLGLLEFFDLVIPILFGLDIFPSVVNPEQSYTLGERVESTIGNPAYLASYLSIISFMSIGLIFREIGRAHV